MYRDETKVILVCTCHEQSRRTTDKYLTVAIPVIVNKEFMPIKLKIKHDKFLAVDKNYSFHKIREHYILPNRRFRNPLITQKVSTRLFP